MRRSDFSYALPKERIAQYPLRERSASRLLCLDGDTGALEDRRFDALLTELQPRDLLIFNDTRVIPARLYGIKASGGKVEILVERLLEGSRVLAQVRASKAPKPGSLVYLEDGVVVRVQGRSQDLFELAFQTRRPVLEILEHSGHMPLPPYIQRPDSAQDAERYQTVYGCRSGAVAAPTAGLHFDQQTLERLAKKRVAVAFLTLHVGAGTFQPLRVERVQDHQMHSEWIDVSARLCEQVAVAKAQGGRVIAVGTTVARSLETAAQGGRLAPYTGETDLFIYPGYRFCAVDALVTNFHLPESTLLMLVCAFGGYEHVMGAYRHAVAQGYRFFSYGDAMFVTRRTGV